MRSSYLIKSSLAFISVFLLPCPASPASFVNGQAARAVVGQSNFTDGTAGALQNLLGGVSGIAWANGYLMTADSNRLGAGPQNNRVLLFPTSQIPGPYDEVQNANHPSTTCYLCGFLATVVVGQQDFTSNTPGRSNLPSGSGTSNYAGTFNLATSVSSDGQYFAVADTNNNRVLLWNSIPTSQTTPPNVVLGQSSFTSFQTPQVVNANSLRGPEGVWVRNGKLYVADTQNNRVLIWTSIPTQNNQPANIVLGQKDFNSNNAPPPGKTNPPTAATQLYTPVSVTTTPDSSRLFVSDLGSNRVLIWNSVPTANTTAADVVVGQPDLTTGVPNWATVLCSNTSAARCESTLDFPRYALSDGTRLFIADGGNDRVLIYNSVPTSNGAKADTVLGQPDFATDNITNQAASIASTAIDNTSSVDTIPSPMSLAWDNTNLYVSDPYNRRVLVFTPADVGLPANAVVNWASEIIRQEGVVVLGVTTINSGDTATVTIQGTAYTYTVKSGDTIDTITAGLITAINAGNGDPNVTALKSGISGTIYLSSKGTNLAFDAISLSASVSNATNLSVTTSGSYLSAGTAATASPGMLVEINAAAGTTIADQIAAIPDPPSSNLSTSLGGVEVYMDGIPQPLVKVSPSQIVSLVPWSFSDRNSTSIYVKTTRADGTTTVTSAAPAYIASANPGLFSDTSSGTPPYPAANARHQAGNPSAVVSVDGTAKAGDTGTITILGSRSYTYTVKAGDSLASIVLGLATAINNANDPDVTAVVGAAFTRVVVQARRPGIAGNGIAVTTSTSSSAQMTLTPYTPATCCDVISNSPITADNPAQVGETIVLSAAGLGTIGNDPTAGILFNGLVPNTAANSVSATMGGSTAQIVSAGLDTNSYGKYSVNLIVPTGLGANRNTQVYIAQNAFVSNIVTVPVGTPSGATPAPAPTPSTPAPPTPTCSYAVSSTTRSYIAAATSGGIGVTAPGGCAWTAAVDQSWVTLTKSSTLAGSDFISYSLAANTTGQQRTANLTISGGTTTLTVSIVQNATSNPTTAALQYVPLNAPCRAVDTRFGQGPVITGGTTRDFAISGPCGIPANAQAFLLNSTVVPTQKLQYLQLWATGGTQPSTSVLNSFDGRIKANSTVVQTGNNGSVSAYATDDSQLILDVSGYFVPAGTASALAFYPLAPCRIADTRLAANAPSLSAGQARTFSVAGTCGVPSTAKAYSLNVTALPQSSLTYLTAWPSGQAQPATSTLNAPTGTVVANAAIVQAGTSNGVQVYSTANADVILDVNGYFDTPGSANALNFYSPAPCRVLDTRFEAIFAPLTGTFNGLNVATDGCAVPPSAQSYLFNVTALPTSTLAYLTLWASGASQPLVSTLNAYDGAVASNLAIVPQNGSSINLFTTDPAYLILDLNGYFAP